MDGAAFAARRITNPWLAESRSRRMAAARRAAEAGGRLNGIVVVGGGEEEDVERLLYIKCVGIEYINNNPKKLQD